MGNNNPIRRPTGNYEADFRTAVELYITNNCWYYRFLNDAHRKLNVDFFEFKNKVESFELL